MCWNVVSDEPVMKRCISLNSTLPDPYRNEIIYGLLSATKYNVTITRCGDDGTNLEYSASKLGITRSGRKASFYTAILIFPLSNQVQNSNSDVTKEETLRNWKELKLLLFNLF